MQIVYGIIAVVAVLTFVVVALRSRSLPHEIREEYERLAEWADSETRSLMAGYEEAGLLSDNEDEPVMDHTVEPDGTIRLLRRT